MSAASIVADLAISAPPMVRAGDERGRDGPGQGEEVARCWRSIEQGQHPGRNAPRPEPNDLARFDVLEVLCPRSSFGGEARDRLVCNCHKVSEARLRQAITAGAATMDALTQATKAGTGCGSCRSELAQLLGAGPPPTPAKVAAAG